ncbi:MAG: hypothetical protein VYB54_07625 [Pseudomonadota bacterium]|nr:hypothetical protein [Pseudomonadota bacterium]
MKKKGRPRKDGPREPSGRLSRASSPVEHGGTPEARIKRYALALMAGQARSAKDDAGKVGKRGAGGLEKTSAPIELLHAVGLAGADQYAAAFRLRELHRIIYGDPGPATRAGTGREAVITPAMQAEHRQMMRALAALPAIGPKVRDIVVAIVVQECWPAWLMDEDGWAGRNRSDDATRVMLLQVGLDTLVQVWRSHGATPVRRRSSHYRSGRMPLGAQA